MKVLQLHDWNLTPGQACDLQLRLRDRVELTDRISRLTCVAGADVALELPEPRSWETGKGRAVAGVVVYRFPQMEEIERTSAVSPLTFPYVPGLLSFREIPALLAAFARLRHTPDLIYCDAQGYAHPRRFGLACHLGILLDCPTIGVAKSRLIGEHREPGKLRGSIAPLVDPESGEKIGAVVRTANGINPVFVSTGHRVSLAHAVDHQDRHKRKREVKAAKLPPPGVGGVLLSKLVNEIGLTTAAEISRSWDWCQDN
jgi:deoxyribonuclease V